LEKSILTKRKAQRLVRDGDLEKACEEMRRLVSDREPDPYDFVYLGDLLDRLGRGAEALDAWQEAVTSYERAGLYRNAIAVGKKILRRDRRRRRIHQILSQLYLREGFAGDAVGHLLELFDLQDEGAPVPEECLRILDEVSAQGGLRPEPALRLADHMIRLRLEDRAAGVLYRLAEDVAATGSETLAREIWEKAHSAEAVYLARQTAEAAPLLQHPAPASGQAGTAAFGDSPLGAGPLNLELSLDLGPGAAVSSLEPEAGADLTPPDVRSGAEPPAPDRGPAADPSFREGGPQAGVPAVDRGRGSDASLLDASAGAGVAGMDAVAGAEAASPARTTRVLPSILSELETSSPRRGDSRVDQARCAATGMTPVDGPEATLEATPADPSEPGVMEIEGDLDRLDLAGLDLGEDDTLTGAAAEAEGKDQESGDTGEWSARQPGVEDLGPRSATGPAPQEDEWPAGAHENARAALERGDHEATRALLEAALKLHPFDCSAHEGLLVLAAREGNERERIRRLNALGEAWIERGNLAEAMRRFLQVLAVDPADPTARRRVQRLDAMGVPREATAPNGSVDPGAAPDGEWPSGGTPSEGRIDLAAHAVEATVQVSSSAPAGDHDEWMDLAGLLEEFKNGVKNQIDGSDVQSHYDLAVSHRGMGLPEDALEEIELVLAQEGLAAAFEGQVRELKADCLMDLKRHREAIHELREALDRSQEATRRLGLLYRLGWALEAVEEWPEAAEVYDQILQKSANYRDVTSRLDECRRRSDIAA